MTNPADGAARPHRQEKDRATEEITELAPGVLRSQLPVELPGLGHVNCYLLQDGDGVALVDPGLPGDDAWDALVGRLGLAGYTVDDVHTVICTHSHADHYGGAHRLSESTDLDIVTHADFASMFDRMDEPEFFDLDGNPLEGDPEDVPVDQRMTRNAWGTFRKPPPPQIRELMEETNGNAFRTPTPSRRVTDGQVITLARREWVAVHTPGHTADHLCLYDPTEGIMISGDHVLPTITPHIGGHTGADNPLQQFFDSLQRMTDFDDVKLVLPAHGHPFTGLGARATEIAEHHHGRLQELRDVGESAATVETYMRELFRERSWGDMAQSETYAHLLHLRQLGEMEVGHDDDGLLTFALTPR